jgi:hypothetical protein
MRSLSARNRERSFMQKTVCALLLWLSEREATWSGMRLTPSFSGMRTVEDRLLLCAVLPCSCAENDDRRDGNGYPKTKTRWVKTLLGHEYSGF